LPFGQRDAHGRQALQLAIAGAAHQMPGAMLLGPAGDNDRGHIPDIDRTAIARGDQQLADIRHALQCLSRHDLKVAAVFAQIADQEGPVGIANLVDELV
jgi:hypothetical protein